MASYAGVMRFPLAAILFVFVMPLRAQPADDERALFRKLDTNHDGYLSAQELAAPQATQSNWIAVDRNADGRISPAEFGIVRNFAAAQPSAAAGATRGAEQEKAKAEGRP